MPGPSSGAFVDQTGTAPSTVLPANVPGAPTAGAFAGLVAGPSSVPGAIAVVVDSPTVLILMAQPVNIAINASVNSPTVAINLGQPAVTMAIAASVNSPTVAISMVQTTMTIAASVDSPTVLILSGAALSSQDLTSLTSQDLSALESVN